MSNSPLLIQLAAAMTLFNMLIIQFQHQSQVAIAVDRAKQITMAELNAVMQVLVTYHGKLCKHTMRSTCSCPYLIFFTLVL